MSADYEDMAVRLINQFHGSLKRISNKLMTLLYGLPRTSASGRAGLSRSGSHRRSESRHRTTVLRFWSALICVSSTTIGIRKLGGSDGTPRQDYWGTYQEVLG